MVRVDVAIPDALHEFLTAEIVRGGFTSAREYIAQLVEDAQRRAASEKLEALLIEGLESGPGRVVDEDFWKERWEVLERRLAEKRR